MNTQTNQYLTFDEMNKLKQFVRLIDQPLMKNPITLEFFTNEYEKFIGANHSKKYLLSISITFKHFKNYFTPQRIMDNITLKDAEEFVRSMQIKAPSGFRVYYRNIKAAFNKAKDWEYVQENVFTKIKLPKRQRIKPEYIDRDQLSAISRQIENNVVRDVVNFAFYTGCRLGEIENLKWSNVDIENRLLTIGDDEFITKARKQRVIPISDKVLRILEKSATADKRKTQDPPRRAGVKRESKSIRTGYVFCKNNGDSYTGDYYSRQFKKACRKAGISKKIHFHSLRHSFASNLVKKGVALYPIKELLGHSSISTTEIYAHLNMDALKSAISTLN